jgi:uncharacterized membrane protein SirB2
MNLAAWYPWIKQAHIGLVSASGALFVLRALALLAGAHWPMRPLARISSVAIDTLLLAAGATLWALLQLNPLRDHWLGAKLALLVVYVVLGTWALKRSRGMAQRVLFFAAAVLVFATMVSIALTRRPLGLWAGLV